MKYFQDLTIERVPLLIKENPWVEINSTRLAGSTEKYKEEGFSGQLISCPEPVFEQVSPGINQLVSVLCPPMHFEDMMPQVNNHEGHKIFFDQLNSPDIRYYDPVGSYMKLSFPKALEAIDLFPFSTFGGMDNMLSLTFIWLPFLPSIMWSICSGERDRITK
jgi:hypothetical protein